MKLEHGFHTPFFAQKTIRISPVSNTGKSADNRMLA